MKREEKEKCSNPVPRQQDTPPQTPPTPTRPGIGRRLSRKVGVGIPRAQTFKRQEDEQRKNLEPVQTSVKDRRDGSRVRQRALSAQPVPPKSVRRQGSAPEVGHVDEALPSISTRMQTQDGQYEDGTLTVGQPPSNMRQSSPRPPTEDNDVWTTQDNPTEASYNDLVDEEIRVELEQRWILNLSMHFRDKSPREKFFVTYAKTPQNWLRVTISVDYRKAPPDSLEADLQTLQSQRDKNARVYESIRLSLPDIQFYDTVTNLKLETKDDRLHVHVTEDVNEIISYPHTKATHHLHVKHYKESDLHFVEHMSGFVYKVTVGTHTWIKKEIPGPDSVEEFLYEINALSELVHSQNVIELKGLVVSDDHAVVKGLLIAYADQGALVDIVYDDRGHLPWERRERWARDIVRGLSEIHEAGFVQGDFTLSNIVVDSKDKAKIIDINRRGCPVGWEPPEIGRLIEHRQRISMFIGVKTDVFQLGMVLWALATETDEPEMQSRPLLNHQLPDEVPEYFRKILQTCLSDRPAKRLSCKEILQLFPEEQQVETPPALLELTGQVFNHQHNANAYPPIEDQDFSMLSRSSEGDTLRELSSQPLSYETTRSDTLELDDDDLVAPHTVTPTASVGIHRSDSAHRGRSPVRSIPNLPSPPELDRTRSESTDEPNIIPISPSTNPKWAEVMQDGKPYLVHRDTLDSLDDEKDLRSPQEDDQQQHQQDDYFKDDRRVSRRIDSGFRGGFEHVDSGLADMDLESNSPTKTFASAGADLGTIQEDMDKASKEVTTAEARTATASTGQRNE